MAKTPNPKPVPEPAPAPQQQGNDKSVGQMTAPTDVGQQQGQPVFRDWAAI